MSQEFWKPGTRIRIEQDPGDDEGLYFEGWIGTVLESSAHIPVKQSPGVEFDPGFESGSGGVTNMTLGTPRPGCCRWYVEPECIEVIPDGPVDYSKYDEGGVV